MADRRVLVTGSRGFVGRRLVARLRTGGTDVLELPPSSTADLTREETLRDVPAVDAVVHLAARSFNPAGFQQPAAMYHNNIVSTLNVVEYCRRTRVPRIVFMSSYVYGEPRYLPIDEQHPLDIKSPYGRSKRLSEEIVRAYHDDFGLQAVVLRPFNIYGPGQDGRFLVPVVIDQVASDAPLVRLQTLEPRRDFVYVDDVVEAIVRGIGYESSAVEIFNLASGHSTSVAELVQLAMAVCGRAKPVETSGEARPHEVMDTVGDSSRARRLLGWAPRWRLEDGLKEMFRAAGVEHVQR